MSMESKYSLAPSKTSLAQSMSSLGLLSAANNEFTNDVYQHLAANTPHNAIISPLGLHMVLGLTSYGAAGSTADAMMKTLRIKHSEALLKEYKDTTDQLSKSTEIKIANTIYFAQNVQLNPIYQQQAVEYFNSELSKTDFTKPETAAKQMNDWVSAHTNGKIKDLIQSVTPDTKLVLINAIYFKGRWLIPFNPKNTKDGPFYLDNTKSVQVPMMQMTDKFYIYQETEDDGFKVLELLMLLDATKEDERLFSMHIFLPNKRIGLATLEKKLFHSDSSGLKGLFKAKHSSFADEFGKITNGAQEAEVVVTLPRFKIESSWEMSNLCKQLGMNVAFTDRADFSLMTQDKMPLTIGQIVQKAFIEVNEEGTEAAAATDVKMLLQSAPPQNPPPPIYFTADHPFIVTISSISDRNILFVAKLANLE